MIDKSLNRRKFLKVAVFGTAATALAACAPQTVEVTRQVEKKVEVQVTKEVVKEVSKNVEVTKEVVKEVVKEVAVTAVPENLKGELIFWGHADHPIYDAGQAFMAKNPNAKFTHVEMADWPQKVEATFAAGSGAPDLIWWEASDIQKNARRKVLLETTELIKRYEKDLPPAKLAEAAFEGKYFGMCGDISPNNLWFRPDIMEKAGIKDMNADIKFDEYLQLSKDVKAKTGSSMYIMESTFDGQGKLQYYVPFYELGGNVSDDTGNTILVDNEAGMQAMEFAKQSWDAKAGLDAGWFSPPYWAAIKAGKLGGTYSPPWMRGFFQTEVNTPDAGQGKWRNQLLPIYPGSKARSNVWGGATLTSTIQSKDNATLIQKFMEYTFCTIEGATVTGNWGIIPPYLPWLKSYFKLTKQTLFEGGWDWTGQIVKSLDQMRPDFYRLPAYGLWDANVAKFALPIFKGEKSVKDGVKEFADFVRGENKKLMDAISG